MTLELVPADGPALETLRSFLRDAGLPTTGVGDGPGQFYLVTEATETVGGGGVEPYGEAALLRSVVVRPDRRDEGVGAVLVDRLCDVAGALGATEAWLLTETAAPFFAGLGFERAARADAPEAVRESTEFAELCGESATCMVRPVDGSD